MTDRPASSVTVATPEATGLEPDAIGVVQDTVIGMVLPLAAAGFLGWIIVRSMQQAGAPENWSILGIVGVGVILMFVARFGLRSPFFGIPRESSDA